jgi:hypothetical protein
MGVCQFGNNDIVKIMGPGNLFPIVEKEPGLVFLCLAAVGMLGDRMGIVSISGSITVMPKAIDSDHEKKEEGAR